MKRLAAKFIVLMCLCVLTGCSEKKEVISKGVVNSPAPTISATQKVEEQKSTKPEETLKSEDVGYTSKKIKTSGLDSTLEDWWFGNNVDDKNRPLHPVECQESSGKYGADFIKEDKDKKIYLTFDEGYENGFTPKILDTLKEKNCKAVFFVTMDFVKSNGDLVKRMIDEGHIVGNHSLTHPAAGVASFSEKEQENEVMVLHNYIKEKYNYNMYLFRYPAGKYSVKSLAIINNLNYRSVFWSFAYLDYDTENQPNENEALNKLINKLHPGAIYLLHAVSKTNTNILGDFIDKARKDGYEFCKYTVE